MTTRQARSILFAFLLLAFGLPSPVTADAGKDLVLTARTAPVAGERRLALVIGNEAYTGDGVRALKNPMHDANAMASTLSGLGFTVRELVDADRDGIRDAVHDFARDIRKSPQQVVALLYYSGHGMQVNGQNYLIPIGFTMPKEADDIVDYGYPTQKALDEMQAANARVNIVILDACRSNPYDTSRAIAGKGLVKMEASGVYIAYATAEGKTADDDPDSPNGMYTRQLLKALKTPGLDIHQVFQLARRSVYEASDHEQYPYDYDGLLSDDFYFDGRPHSTSTTHALTPISAEERKRLNGEMLASFGAVFDDIAYGRVSKTAPAADVKRLLDQGADPNARDSTGQTILTLAAAAGNEPVVQILLDAGADVNAVNRDSQTALERATTTGLGRESKNLQVVNDLIAAGADVNATSNGGINALQSAVEDSSVDIVKAILGAGAKVDAKIDNGDTPLLDAANLGRADVVSALLAAGADKELKGADGSTPLINAASDVETAKVLIAAGADKNASNSKGETALMRAASRAYVDVVQALIDAGVDVNAKDNDGKTALIRAAAMDSAGAVKALLAAGASVNVVDGAGHTALSHAKDPDIALDTSDEAATVAALTAAGATE